MDLDAWTQPVVDAQQAQACQRQLQHALNARGLVLRPPPAQPTTCCGRGCNGCVWESYFMAFAYWQEQAGQALAGT